MVQPIEKVDVCRQLVTGIKYLHDKGICHTDLRPANVLITQVGRVVIGNYAVAPMNTENKVCVGFSNLSNFLERILMEHIEQICSLESKLFFMSICFIRTRSRK